MKEDAMKKLLRSSNPVTIPEEEWDDLLDKAAWNIKGRGTPEEKVMNSNQRPMLLETYKATCSLCCKPASWYIPMKTGQFAHMCHDCAKIHGEKYFMSFLLRGGK